MIGDPGGGTAVESGVSVLGVYQAIANIGSGWTTGGLLNPGGGLGASALRGIAAAGLAMQRVALRNQATAERFNYAQADASMRFVAGEHPQLKVEPDISVTPEIKRLGAVVQKFVALGKLKQAAHAEAKLQRTVASGPPPTFTYYAQYGPNNGPPLRGS